MAPEGLDLILPSWRETLPGLLLSAVPLVASVAIAARQGGPIWLAALVAWVMGWFGLLLVILYYFTPRRSESGVEEGHAVEMEPSEGPGSRLRTLERLRVEGLITQAEYERKRHEVLERL